MFSTKIGFRLLIPLCLLCLLLTLQIFEWTVRSPAQLVPGKDEEGPSAYTLAQDYSGKDFFSGFNFEDAPSPTHGHVRYQSRRAAEQLNLTYVGNDHVAYIHVDSVSAAPQGRASVRISTKRTFTRGLFVLDLLHMPTGCSTWPAFWTTAKSGWPSYGEIDIIEGVNLEQDNAMTLHTGRGCRQPKERQMLGTAETMDCDVQAKDQWPNQGCGVKTKASFGQALNDRGGAVVVMEWTRKTIKIWQFFDRAALPADLMSGSAVDPSTWDVLPSALFQDLSCPIDKIFKDHVAIINTELCGDWAGNTYMTSTCPGTCNNFVSNNPHAFKEAYWAIRSLRVYQR